MQPPHQHPRLPHTRPDCSPYSHPKADAALDAAADTTENAETDDLEIKAVIDAIRAHGVVLRTHVHSYVQRASDGSIEDLLKLMPVCDEFLPDIVSMATVEPDNLGADSRAPVVEFATANTIQKHAALSISVSTDNPAKVVYEGLVRMHNLRVDSAKLLLRIADADLAFAKGKVFLEKSDLSQCVKLAITVKQTARNLDQYVSSQPSQFNAAVTAAIAEPAKELAGSLLRSARSGVAFRLVLTSHVADMLVGTIEAFVKDTHALLPKGWDTFCIKEPDRPRILKEVFVKKFPRLVYIRSV